MHVIWGKDGKIEQRWQKSYLYKIEKLSNDFWRNFMEKINKKREKFITRGIKTIFERDQR